jgi:hypothetical protein
VKKKTKNASFQTSLQTEDKENWNFKELKKKILLYVNGLQLANQTSIDNK